MQFSVGSRQSLCFPVLIHKHGSALNRPIVTQRAKVVLGEATSPNTHVYVRKYYALQIFLPTRD